MKLNYRHGDICLIGIDTKPEELKASKTKILLLAGSGGHPHSFDRGNFYPVENDQFVIGYLEAKKTKLFHQEHGKEVKGKQLREVKIEDGLYQVRRQVEYTPEGLRRVID